MGGIPKNPGHHYFRKSPRLRNRPGSAFYLPLYLHE
jgi:hypothetical protein